jgi:hypothetical protein
MSTIIQAAPLVGLTTGMYEAHRWEMYDLTGFGNKIEKRLGS